MDLSKKRINIQNSFDYDIKKFQKELNLEMTMEKRIKKILQNSNRNVRDCILTGELKIKMDKTLKPKAINKENNKNRQNDNLIPNTSLNLQTANANTEKSIINNQINNNNSILIISNLNNDNNDVNNNNNNNNNLSAINYPQGIADISSNLNNTNILNNLNSLILRNPQNSSNIKVGPNSIVNRVPSKKEFNSSEPLKNLDKFESNQIESVLNQANKIFMSELNENTNDKVIVKNLFKEYRLKNTNDKKRMIEDKLSQIDQQIKYLDDQINQPKNSFSPKLFSSKLIVNSIVNPKKPRTLKLSDDTERKQKEVDAKEFIEKLNKAKSNRHIKEEEKKKKFEQKFIDMINNENNNNKKKVAMKIQKIQNYISINFPESDVKTLNSQSQNLKRNKNLVNSLGNMDVNILGSNLKKSQNILVREEEEEYKSDFVEELKKKYLKPSKNNLLKNSVAVMNNINNTQRENKKRIQSPYKINFKDERAKVIKLSGNMNLEDIEQNSFVESPKPKNFRVKNKDVSQDFSSSKHLENSQVHNLDYRSGKSQRPIPNSNLPDKHNISNFYQDEDNNDQSHLNVDQVIKNRSIESKNYLKKNRNFLNYLNNSNNNLIDLNLHNNDIILPSTSEMIKIPNQDLSSEHGSYNKNNLKRMNLIANSPDTRNNINNFNAIINNQNDISREKYLNSNILKTKLNSYSPIPKTNLNQNPYENDNNEIYKTNKRPSTIKLPNINHISSNNRSRNDTSINKRPVSMIKTNANNESSIDNSRINSYRKKSPYYFNDPKLYRLMEERNHNISLNNKLKNLVNLSESHVKHYNNNNNSRINHHNKSNLSIDDVEDYEILKNLDE